MTPAGLGLLAAWTALVWTAYWPSFVDPTADVWKALVWKGLPLSALVAIYAAAEHAGQLASDAWRALGWQGLPLDVPAVLGAAAGHLGRLAAAAAILLAARGAGARVGSLARIRVPAVLGALPLGIAVLGAAVLGLGLTGLWFKPILGAVVLLAVAAGGRPAGLALFPAGTGRGPRWLIAAVAVPAFAGALAPEVTYDALAYHVGAPVQFLLAHRIVRLDHMMFTDFPLTLEMLYGLGFALGGGAGCAKLVHALLGLAATGAAARLGRRLAGRAAGDWTVVFLAATPFLATQMMRANDDLGVMLLVTAGAWWLLGAGVRSAAVAGACLGGAAGIKLTGGYGVVAGLAAVLVARASGRRIAAFLAAAAVPLAAWLARTWLAAGNPVYPFGSPWLGGVGWTAANAAMYRADMTGPTSFNLQYVHAVDWLAAPWRMVMHDRGGEAALGPFVLTLVPALALLGGPAFGARVLGVFGAAFWSVWLLTARDPRFFLPAWPIAAALAATALMRMRGAVARPARWLLGAGAAFAPFIAAHLAYVTLNPGPVDWGAVPRAAYVARLIPPPGLVPFVRRANGRLGPTDRVLVVGDVKACELAAPARYPSLFDTNPLEAWTREAPDAARLRVRVREGGITAVLYNVGGALYLNRQFGHFTFNPAAAARLTAVFRGWLPLLERRDGRDLVYALYRTGPVPARPLRPAPPLPGTGSPAGAR